MCVPLTSRHLLCVYVNHVLRLCFPVPGRVVLCVSEYSATHCIVPRIRWGVCRLLRGTCCVRTFHFFAVCYGCAALCLDVSYNVPEYCAIHCIVAGIRGCVCHLLRGTCSVVRLFFCFVFLGGGLPCATAVLPCAWTCRTVCTGIVCYPERVALCVPVYCATYCIVPGICGSASHTSRHLLFLCVSRVLRLCCLVHECFVPCVPVYYATHRIIPGIRGCV